jgi:ABC-type sugar transport system ATPase subunit
MSSIEFKHVGKSYGEVEVVKDLSLSIKDGDFVSLLGPSGCGKTTCLRMVAGLEKNSKGKILIDDEVVSDPESSLFIPPENRHIGMVFQSYAVWPHMNVFDNVAYPLKLRKIPQDEIKRKVFQVLEMVQLDGLEKREPKALSGGQQQRVALARGLIMEPKVLLLDEPLSNLDAKLREKMRKDIRELQQRLRLTCLYVTHDQIEAFTMSDQIVIMSKGDILQKGQPEEIRNNPTNEFVADFIN